MLKFPMERNGMDNVEEGRISRNEENSNTWLHYLPRDHDGR
jgi:hypothetical protein